MTIGQRIAQKRKEQGLSQEALGDRLGLSRQAIYKWESDAALPEIDKLVALSRLFGVSVGWLLGVEETPEVLQDTGSELTETQLSMVEEIVNRYLTARPRPEKSAWDKWSIRILFALCGVMLAALTGISGDVRQLDGQAAGLRTSINDVTSAVSREMDSLSRRVEEILESQDSLFADSGVEIVHTSLQSRDGGTVIFDAYAVPKTYVEGMTAEFVLDNGTGGIAIQAGEFRRSTQAFSADSIACTLTDEIDLSITLIAPDGTRQTQLLERYDGLYTASLPSLRLNSFPEKLRITADGFTPQEAYVSLEKLPGQYFGAYGDHFPSASAEEVQVGLFRNHALVAWAEPCEIPDGFRGYEEGDFQFYRLPEAPVTAAPGDMFSIAALVTDQYGRAMIYSEDSFTVDTQNSVIAHSTPADSGMLWTAPDQWRLS